MPHEFLKLGVREIWNQQCHFGLGVEERARHLWLLGQTGTGKSTLIANLVRQDIESGAGVTLIDPHGDLVDAVCDAVPSHRIDDVVIIDPTDHAHVPAFNPFYRVAIDDRPRVTANLVTTFKHVWRDSWGPRLEHILRNTVRLALDSPDELRPSLLSVARILVEPGFRERTLRHSTDPPVTSFFRDEFGRWPERQRAEALSPVQNKLGAVLANPFVRNIVSQWKPTVSLDEIIAQERVLLVRVPKGALGEEQANLVGSLLVSGLMQSAMTPTTKRVPHHLFIDEFASFTTESFASILSEARKFKLNLAVANQFIEQIASPAVQASLFGNVGTIVSFRVGAADADRLAHECRDIAASRFADLKRGQVIVKAFGDGGLPITYVGRTAPPVAGVGTSGRVIAKNRRAHTRPRAVVEKRIGQWLRR